MKVLLVNGSPHQKGCTYTALCEVERALNEEGIDTEIFWIGNKPIGGCIACGGCSKLKKCAIDDCVNEFNAKAATADGFIFGSPVHYAAASGNITAFMDRAFYSDRSGIYRLKPAAAVLSARRAGTTAAFDQLNKYFTIKEMPIVSSRYWNMVHGAVAEEVLQDEEGMMTMYVLGKNMAYMLKCKQAAKAAGIDEPEPQPRKWTNFIR